MGEGEVQPSWLVPVSWGLCQRGGVSKHKQPSVKSNNEEGGRGEDEAVERSAGELVS